MKKSDQLSGSFGRLLRQSRELLWKRMSQELANEGLDLNFSQFIVIKNLGNGPQMPSMLAECAAINAGAMTRVIDSLIEQGVVTRTVSDTDRRASQVTLTKQGHALAKQLAKCGERTLKQAFSGISPARLAELEDTLTEIIDNLQPDSSESK